MEACHHYGQKQEGCCQLHDPHKTEQEILAGGMKGTEMAALTLTPHPPTVKTVPLIYPAECEACSRKERVHRGRKSRKSSLSETQI